MIGRLLMVLVGLVLGMLGVITTIHSDHNVLGVIVFIHGQHYEVGILISFAGICSIFGGLPYYE